VQESTNLLLANRVHRDHYLDRSGFYSMLGSDVAEGFAKRTMMLWQLQQKHSDYPQLDPAQQFKQLFREGEQFFPGPDFQLLHAAIQTLRQSARNDQQPPYNPPSNLMQPNLKANPS
jgi:hypothetical protein